MSRRNRCCCCPSCSSLPDSYTLSGGVGSEFFKIQVHSTVSGVSTWAVYEINCVYINAEQGGLVLGPVILDRTEPGACAWEYTAMTTQGESIDSGYVDYASQAGPPSDLCSLGQGSSQQNLQWPFSAQLEYLLEFICQDGKAEWKLTATLNTQAQTGGAGRTADGAAGVTIVLSSGQFTANGNPPAPFFTTITTTAPCNACQGTAAAWQIS